MRGKLDLHYSLQFRVRLIPACAGKTRGISGSSLTIAAHPRVCGENFPNLEFMEIQLGSSPRVRGKPPSAEEPVRRVGLIPACAGKTRSGAGISRTPSAHPRVCGENMVSTKGTARSEGSSPRVRGKPVAKRCRSICRGLIPACAGKTVRGVEALQCGQAHPRVCGENSQAAYQRPPARGSSPRVRGKLGAWVWAW